MAHGHDGHGARWARRGGDFGVDLLRAHLREDHAAPGSGKLARIRRGARPNPLVDPAGYAKLVADGEADYLARLEAERR